MTTVRLARSALRLATVLALVSVALLPGLVRADALDDSVRRVALQLQCPVCEGQSAADSPSGLAGDMRAVIRARLSAGASDQQILDEFVASYGDSILSDPPKRGISLGVWLGPTIGVVLGSVLLVTVLRAWRRAPRPVAAPVVASGLDGDLDREVVDEFSRFRQEVGP